MGGKQATIDEQANTPALGAEGVAEKDIQVEGSELEAKTPEWVSELLESNVKVIESNQSVVDALTEFKDRASRTVGDYDRSLPVNTEKEVDIHAEYVVAEGKTFRDNKDFNKVYEAGDSAGGFDEVVLKRLLNQGLIEES